MISAPWGELVTFGCNPLHQMNNTNDATWWGIQSNFCQGHASRAAGNTQWSGGHRFNFTPVISRYLTQVWECWGSKDWSLVWNFLPVTPAVNSPDISLWGTERDPCFDFYFVLPFNAGIWRWYVLLTFQSYSHRPQE